MFNAYDYIIVVSEASKLRHFVSTLSSPKKIQWIHTDYVSWRNHSGWTKKITANDKKTYKKYDKIVCLSNALREKFSDFYPSLKDKVVAIPNLIDYDAIVKNSLEKSQFEVDKSKLNLITIGRMEAEKRYDSILLLASELKTKGVDFSWHLVGDGPLLSANEAMCRDMNLSEEVIFTGYIDNVCPLLKQCDLFVLLSEYEGTPVTIDEAKVLGIPVLAKNVGGIADQITNATGKALNLVSAGDIINFDYKSYSKMQKREFEEYNNQIIDKLKSILQ